MTGCFSPLKILYGDLLLNIVFFIDQDAVKKANVLCKLRPQSKEENFVAIYTKISNNIIYFSYLTLFTISKLMSGQPSDSPL